jgi:hypothetical protein
VVEKRVREEVDTKPVDGLNQPLTRESLDFASSRVEHIENCIE